VKQPHSGTTLIAGLALLICSTAAFADSTTSIDISKATTSPKALHDELALAIGNSNVTVTVTKLYGERYDVALKGEVNDDDALKKVIDTANSTAKAINAVQPGAIPDKHLHTDAVTVKKADTKDPNQIEAAKIVDLIKPYFQDKLTIVEVRPVYGDTPMTYDKDGTRYTDSSQFQLVLRGTPSRMSPDVEPNYQKQAIVEVNAKLRKQAKDAKDKADADAKAKAAVAKAMAVEPTVRHSTGIAPRVNSAQIPTVETPRLLPGAKTEYDPSYLEHVQAFFKRLEAYGNIKTEVVPIEKPQYLNADNADFSATRAGTANEFYCVNITGIVDTIEDLKAINGEAQQIKQEMEDDLYGSHQDPASIALCFNNQITINHASLTDIWPVTSLGEAGAADGASASSIDAMKDALNNLFGTKDTPIAYRDNADLYVSGDLKKALRAKGFLALIDEPSPRVKLDMWAIQMAGNRKTVAMNMGRITSDIAATQSRIEQVKLLMGQSVAKYYQERFVSPSDTPNVEAVPDQDWLFAQVYRRMFGTGAAANLRYFSLDRMTPAERNPLERPLATSELMVLIGIRSDRSDILSRIVNDIGSNRHAQMDKILRRLNCLKANSKVDRSDGRRQFSVSNDDYLAVLDEVSEKLRILASHRNSERSDGTITPDEATQMLFTWQVLAGEEMADRGIPLNRAGGQLFSNLQYIEDPARTNADRAGVNDFMQKLLAFQRMVRALGVYDLPEGGLIYDDQRHDVRYDDTGHYAHDAPDVTLEETQEAPEALKGAGNHIDGMIEDVVDSFDMDLEQTYYRPLLARIQSNEGYTEDGLQDGISLSGKTSVLVNNRRQAAVTPNLVSYVNNTHPSPFGNDLLNMIAPSNGGTSTETDTSTDKDGVTTKTSKTTTTSDNSSLTGASKLLAGLPTAQSAAIAALLSNDVAPTFLKIAPGISVTITPSVAANGESADLNLDTNFGVTATDPTSSDRKDVWPSQLPSAVQGNHVVTYATVDGNRLFEVSSFNITTTTPRAPQYVPILGRLPVIGQAFQFPQGPQSTDFQSVLLVNALVVPRSLGLVGFYGANRVGHIETTQPLTPSVLPHVPCVDCTQPTDLMATPKIGAVHLSWSPVKCPPGEAVMYTVKTTFASGAAPLIAPLTTSQTDIDVKGLKKGLRYEFVVVATIGDKPGSSSRKVFCRPFGEPKIDSNNVGDDKSRNYTYQLMQ